MSTLLYQNGTSLFGKKENVFTVVSRISLFFSCFQQERKDLRGFAKLHAWQNGTLLHSGWKLLKKVSFYNIATNLMPPLWGCPPTPKGGIRFQIRKVRHFWWFYSIVLLLSSQTELESGILKWDSKKFFVKPTTFEGHLMRHLHKFGQ